MEDFSNAGFLSEEEMNLLYDQEENNPNEGENIDKTETPNVAEEDSGKKASTPVKEEEDDSTEEIPESVGDDNQEEAEDANEDVGSPKSSSIAKAFKEIGILSTLDDDRMGEIQSMDDLADAFEEEVQNRMDAHNKFVYEALQYKVPVSLIQQFEGALTSLNGITDEALEDEENEDTRKGLIYNDLINKGHSPEEAKELTDDYVESGKDIEKSKKALASLKNAYLAKYNQEVEKYKTIELQRREMGRKYHQTLENEVMNDDKVFKDLGINKTTRSKILDFIRKPTERDEKGNMIPKLQAELNRDPIKFNKYVGMFYVLTDGFTKIDNLVKEPVKKGVRKGLQDLEKVLNSTSRDLDGSLNFKSGVSTDSNGFVNIADFDFIPPEE